MSIYVAVPTEYDPEIFYTIKDIVLNSSDPSSIFIGVACMTDLEYFNKIKNEFKTFKNITIKHFSTEIKENVGVGAGRKNALSMYSGQDYILQIDSHTMLSKNWDIVLLKLFKEAIKETKNKKTILTSYLPAYVHTIRDGRSQASNEKPAYCFFRKEEFFSGIEKNIPRWDLKFLLETRFEKKIFKKIKNKKFLPAQKINAQFIFTTKEYFLNSGLPDNVFFYEEEIIQSINLYDLGYSFVWPNVILPLRHLYGWDADKPGSVAQRSRGYNVDLWKKEYYKSGDIYIEFIENKNNFKKCNQYEKYANINLKTGSLNEDIIPLKYRL